MREREGVVAFLVVTLSLFVASVALAYEAVEMNGGGGTIRGKVKFAGNPPPPQVVQVAQDREVCGKTQEIYGVEVKDGGVKNAVVKIVEIKNGKKFDFPEAVLDQKGCTYTPHIVLVPPGELTVTNSDPVNHNVHTYPTKSDPVNWAMTKFKRKISIPLKTPETIPSKCDLHGWMSALIVVAEHPYYAVTGNGGSFELRDVPPGTYTLEVWHEELGEEQQKVTVEAGKTVEVELTVDLQGGELAYKK